MTTTSELRNLIDQALTTAHHQGVLQGRIWSALDQIQALQDKADKIVAKDLARVDEPVPPGASRVQITLLKVGEKKISLIKTLRDHLILGLKEAKDLADSINPEKPKEIILGLEAGERFAKDLFSIGTEFKKEFIV